MSNHLLTIGSSLEPEQRGINDGYQRSAWKDDFTQRGQIPF